MVADKTEILSFIRTKADHPMRPKDLANLLRVSKSEYPRFKKKLNSLIESGDLINLKRGRVGLPDQLGLVVGILSVVRSGTGFVPDDRGGEDILIPQHELLTALDGDKVMVRLSGKYAGRQSGTVIKLVERTDRNIVGIYREDRSFNRVVPDNPRIHRDIYIKEKVADKISDGDRVVVKITNWENPNRNPEGEITERLGKASDPGVDILAVIKEFGFPEKFPENVIAEAEIAATRLEKEDLSDRVDLTGETIYTIDPFDAKDHDDAISVDETTTGFRLGVHIADVSFYIEPGSALDTEAFERGNSVYLPGQVIPMLPEVLSNDICSLKPNRRRAAFSVFIDYDKKGKVKSCQIEDTVIKSKAKLSYEEVQDYFDSKPVPDKIKKVAESLDRARRLANLINKERFHAGSLDFDLPESKIILGKNGEVLELGNRERLESHRLVEEFMLAANQAVALEVFRMGEQFIYRVHDKPDFEKLTAFALMMKRLGYNFPVSKTMKPVQYARFLDKIKDKPETGFINELMLRSMQKAVYQRQNIGHFGLAFKHYTHFTSPIRRYPDLLVHRLLRKLKHGKYPVQFAKRVGGTIDNVGKHCSDTERVAEKAERQAIKIKQVAYMAKHLGDHFDGVITGVIPHGFFVRLDKLGVEGMVRVSSIDDDYYLFDEDNYRLIGRRHNKAYRLGDPVEIVVAKVDRLRNEMELILASNLKPDNKKNKKTKKTKKKAKKQISEKNITKIKKKTVTKKTHKKTKKKTTSNSIKPSGRSRRKQKKKQSK